MVVAVACKPGGGGGVGRYGDKDRDVAVVWGRDGRSVEPLCPALEFV
jgi:hypothetical protein